MDVLDAGETSAAILIPAGFSDAITTGQATEVRIVGIPDSPLGTQIAKSVIGSFASEVGAIQLSIATAADWQPGQPAPPVEPDTVSVVENLPSPIATVDAAMERRQAATSTFYAASMAIMFLFFATVYGPLGLLGERRTGTMARLLAAPIRPASIVFGAAIASFVLGLVSMTILVVATTLLLGASWGPPELVAPLVLTAVLAAMGVSILICTVGRTEEQASGWNAMLSICFAILGGAMFPLSQAPELLRQAQPGDAARLVPACDRHDGRRHGRSRRHRPDPARPPGFLDRDDHDRPGAIPKLPGGEMKALLIARANVTRMFRDRIGLVFTFILPAVIIVVMGMAFGGQGVPHVGIANVDASPLSAELVTAIDRTRGPIELRTFGTAESLRDAVQRNTVDMGLVIPAGYEAAIRAGGTGQVEYVGRPETITSAIRPVATTPSTRRRRCSGGTVRGDQRGISRRCARRRQSVAPRSARSG
jgi:ABC-type Na+ efflux pump permease subunit